MVFTARHHEFDHKVTAMTSRDFQNIWKICGGSQNRASPFTAFQNRLKMIVAFDILWTPWVTFIDRGQPHHNVFTSRHVTNARLTAVRLGGSIWFWNVLNRLQNRPCMKPALTYIGLQGHICYLWVGYSTINMSWWHVTCVSIHKLDGNKTELIFYSSLFLGASLNSWSIRFFLEIRKILKVGVTL